MNENLKKTRRRTGCLSCRRRRVKCDERKPTCRRCEAANVECAGYEQRRQIDTRPPRVSTGEVEASAITIVTRKADRLSVLYPKFRTDGHPLIGLPTNPRPDQRPHARAREILAYHQFLFRTLPLLFPAEHMHFWRDRLCEEAWEVEYIFLTIAALGGIHRAVLLMSTPDRLEISRGLDTKVIAAQTYTEALQQISELSQPQVENSLDIFVGALVILAYFECLFGNIPAAVGHTMDAAHSFLRMRSDGSQAWHQFVPAIEFALRNLNTVCRVILPLPNLGVLDDLGQRLPAFQNLTVLESSPNSPNPSTPSIGLQCLLDFADMHPDVKNLIWDPLTMHERTVLPHRIITFQGQLNDWKLANSHIFPQFDAQILGGPNVEWSCDDIDMLPIPPRPYINVSSQLCLLAALHRFYVARTLWALSLLGGHHDNERHYLAAYRHTYEVMRLVATVISNGEGVKNENSEYLACEALGIGLLPILHSLGQCCPGPTWLRWIMEQSSRLGQEGLFNGEIYAKNLNALHTFEMLSNLDSSSMLEHFPPPSSRVISVLLPGQDGQSHIGFYAGPESPGHRQGDALPRYHPLGHARWTDIRRGGTTRPAIEIYDEQRKLAQPFTRIWLLEQEVSLAWSAWSAEVGFSLDRALRDHISGSCLENAVYEQDVP
ncbi:hypothetical protein PV04_00858 [Phialophora macrospora]|uniref:Zn(2)-C6 fungal-type domain-containing protein n=1 Tax=Phialophora macrospora TaxID=1851006 RepID=A0A0D2G1M5_9EURO|nr:hypothetical protein PV04_00858 [Phialophora macrospora]